MDDPGEALGDLTASPVERRRVAGQVRAGVVLVVIGVASAVVGVAVGRTIDDGWSGPVGLTAVVVGLTLAAVGAVVGARGRAALCCGGCGAVLTGNLRLRLASSALGEAGAALRSGDAAAFATVVGAHPPDDGAAPGADVVVVLRPCSGCGRTALVLPVTGVLEGLGQEHALTGEGVAHLVDLAEWDG